MNRLNFFTGDEMLSYLFDTKDLYNLETGEYVFNYNDFGSIAVYSLTEQEAIELARQADAADEYWGAFLGPGGRIYDDPSYPERSRYAPTNLEYCEETFDEGIWVAADASYIISAK